MSARLYAAASVTWRHADYPPNQGRRQRPREMASFKNAIWGFTVVHFSAEAETLQKRHRTALMEIFEPLRIGGEVSQMQRRSLKARQRISASGGSRREGGIQTPGQVGATLKWRTGRELCTHILGGAALSWSAEMWRGSSADWTLLQFCLSN